MLDHEKDKNMKMRLKYHKNIEKYLTKNEIEVEIDGHKKFIPLIVYLQFLKISIYN